jgi:hypothetical protein
MFCPKCGQQQISDTTRFCSRCGLPTDGLADWLAGDAFLARHDAPVAPKLISHKRRGIRRGGKLLFFSIVLLPIFIGICAIADAAEPIIVPITVFLAGFATLLYYLIFGDDSAPVLNQPARPSALSSALGRNALPPAANTWTNPQHGQRVRTSELAQPPSVTENTTKLLGDE